MAKAPQPTVLSIKPPLAGIQRGAGFQEVPPYSGYDLVNVWPVDVLDGHAAVATRPPLVAFATPGLNVNMLAQLNLPAPTPFAAAGGKLWKFNGVTWNAISSTSGITTGRAVSAAPFLKKLFIANDDAAVYYDDATGILAPYVATLGTVPPNLRILVEYAGSIWGAGDPDNPHIVSRARIGDPFDWDFTVDANDVNAAFEGTSALFGLISEPITAMIPLQGRMLMASENSIYLLTGDPRQGGSLDCLSRSIGILGQGAWAQVLSTTDELYFLSKVGIMKMQTESLRRDLVATPISKRVLPDELLGFDFEYLNPTACLAYESRWGGLIITDRSAEISFLMDLKNGGFFRQTFSAYPTVMRNFDSLLTDDASGLLFGGTGYGGLARFDRTGSEAFASSQLVGPVKMSQSPLYASMLQRASVILGAGTTDLDGTVTFYTANTAQSALFRALSNQASYQFSTTIGSLLSSGKQTVPRLRGHAAVMKIEGSGVAGKRIVFEGCDAEILPSGINRDLGLLAPVITPPGGVITFATS